MRRGCAAMEMVIRGRKGPPPAKSPGPVQESVVLGVQVNGKRRSEIEVPAGAERSDIENAALSDAGVKRHIDGKTVRKIVVVPGRVVNIVAN